jgi:hypothetical protein
VRLAINRTNKDKFAVKVVHKNKLKKQDIDALHVEARPAARRPPRAAATPPRL